MGDSYWHANGLNGLTLSQMAPELLAACELVHNWFSENEAELMERWPADITFLKDVVAEVIDSVRCSGNLIEFSTYEDMGFSPSPVLHTAVSKHGGTAAAILKDLISVSLIADQLATYARPGNWLYSEFNEMAGAIQNAIKRTKKKVIADNERAKQAAWLRDYRDEDGRSWSDLDRQIYQGYTACYKAFEKAFPDEPHPRFALKMARRRLLAEVNGESRGLI